MYYINTLKRELVDTNAYKLQPSLSERVTVDGHGCHTALNFGVKAKENQEKAGTTLYWLPKLHKTHKKQDCVAAVERLPSLHYSVDFIFLSFGIMGFIVELLNY